MIAAVAIGCILAFIAFLFSDLSNFPLVMWDESRLAVNALEMKQNGFSLVTTYQLAPDTWNTKPPLQIWLMSLSLGIFPSAEFALRFPSALCALGTVIMVGVFALRQTGSTLAALVVSVLLITSQGFFGTHVGRTGDYDALLVFFSTAYLLLIFEFLHAKKQEMKVGLLIGLLVAGAVLTKSIAGVIPALGALLYALTSARLRKAAFSPATLASVLLAGFLVALYYFSREQASPGYLTAVWQNEFARYAVPQDPDAAIQTPLRFFSSIVFDFSFSLGPLFFPVMLGWVFAKGRAMLAITYAVLTAAVFLAVVSLSKTLYFWYAAPAYSLLAIACGLSIYSIVSAIREGRLVLPFRLSAAVVPAVLLGLSLLAFKAVWTRENLALHYRDAYESSYRDLLTYLLREGHKSVVVVDPGRGNGAGAAADGHYNPILRFYLLLLEERSEVSVSLQTSLAEALNRTLPNSVVATCNDKVDLRQIERRHARAVGSCWVSTGGVES